MQEIAKSQLVIPELQSERLLLRMMKEDEAPKVVEYHLKNKDHLKDYSPAYSDDYFTQEYWRNQLAANLEEFRSDRSLRLFIFEKNDRKTVIGTVNFSNFVRRAAQYCVLGYGIDKEKQSLGYMTEALKVACEYVFEELNLHRIMANYIPVNEKSARVLKKLGFVVEGYARDYLYLNGKWQDHILTSLTNSNWQEPRN